MKIERIILTLVFVVVVFLAIIALFLYKTLTPSDNVRDFDRLPTIPVNEIPTTSTPTTPPPFDPSTPDSADSHSALDECIAFKASEADGRQYERGSLLVVFQSAMRYETAIDSMRLLNLVPDTSATAKENYEQFKWLTVAVPEGKEFEWQCTLDASEWVRGTNLNTSFNLRQ
jgi:hypothetical protein